jgi:hypothetical protein
LPFQPGADRQSGKALERGATRMIPKSGNRFSDKIIRKKFKNY